MSVGFNASFQRTKISLLSRAKIFFRYYSGTQENVKTKQYTDTVLLPKTEFPAKITGKSRIAVDEYLTEVSENNILPSEF